MSASGHDPGDGDQTIPIDPVLLAQSASAPITSETSQAMPHTATSPVMNSDADNPPAALTTPKDVWPTKEQVDAAYQEWEKLEDPDAAVPIFPGSRRPYWGRGSRGPHRGSSSRRAKPRSNSVNRADRSSSTRGGRGGGRAGSGTTRASTSRTPTDSSTGHSRGVPSHQSATSTRGANPRASGSRDVQEDDSTLDTPAPKRRVGPTGLHLATASPAGTAYQSASPRVPGSVASTDQSAGSCVPGSVASTDQSAISRLPAPVASSGSARPRQSISHTSKQPVTLKGKPRASLSTAHVRGFSSSDNEDGVFNDGAEDDDNDELPPLHAITPRGHGGVSHVDSPATDASDQDSQGHPSLTPSHKNLSRLDEVQSYIPRVGKRKPGQKPPVVISVAEKQVIEYWVRVHILLYGSKSFSPWIIIQVYGQGEDGEPINPFDAEFAAPHAKINDMTSNIRSVLLSNSINFDMNLIESKTIRDKKRKVITPSYLLDDNKDLWKAIEEAYSHENFFGVWYFIKGFIDLDHEETTDAARWFCRNLFINACVMNRKIAITKLTDPEAGLLDLKKEAQTFFYEIFKHPDLDGMTIDEFHQLSGKAAGSKRSKPKVKNTILEREYVSTGPAPKTFKHRPSAAQQEFSRARHASPSMFVDEQPADSLDNDESQGIDDEDSMLDDIQARRESWATMDGASNEMSSPSRLRAARRAHNALLSRPPPRLAISIEGAAPPALTNPFESWRRQTLGSSKDSFIGEDEINGGVASPRFDAQ